MHVFHAGASVCEGPVHDGVFEEMEEVPCSFVWSKTREAGYRLALWKNLEVKGGFWCRVLVSFT